MTEVHPNLKEALSFRGGSTGKPGRKSNRKTDSAKKPGWQEGRNAPAKGGLGGKNAEGLD